MTAQDCKIGNFDWITEYDEIELYLQSNYTGLSDKKDVFRVLVAGCGTSKLSLQLADSGFGEIISVDNDSQCIAHMTEMHKGDDRMKWITYDMVEPPEQSKENIDELGMFEMIVDKGTLDAILVEGAIYTMLFEVHRRLKVGGVYIVFSLNTEKLLSPLLGTKSLGFDTECYAIKKKQTVFNIEFDSGEPEDGLGTVVICKKKNDIIVDIEQLAAEEKEIMDNYFKIEYPFLTLEQEDKVRTNFEGIYLSTNGDNINDNYDIENLSLGLYQAYKAMFEEEDNLEYSYELFLEDTDVYPLKREGYMTTKEAVKFLQTMQ